MNSKNEEYLNSFISYLRDIKRYSDNTILAYKKDIEDFISFIEIEDFGLIDEISSRVSEFYIGRLRDLYTPKSIQRKVSSIKTMYTYLVDILSLIETNPFSLVVLPKASKRLPKIAYEDEIVEFLNSINLNTETGIRDKLIFSLLYYSGIRVSELVNIKIKDISLNEDIILIHGKGSKDRLVPFNNITKELYLDYLIKVRPSLLSRSNSLESEYLFLNFKGTNLTSRGVRDILYRLIKNNNYILKVSPHTFRHSFATHLINSGMDVRMVQELLGHSNLSTTQIYTKLSKESLIETYNKSFPKGDNNDKNN